MNLKICTTAVFLFLLSNVSLALPGGKQVTMIVYDPVTQFEDGSPGNLRFQ